MTRTRSQVAAAAAARRTNDRAQPQPQPQPQAQPPQQQPTTATTPPTHTPLYLLVASENWPAVITRCDTHPSEASSLTPTENLTPLHVACLCDPPPSAISALLGANPTAVNARTSTGLVPLHFACIKSDPEVVRLLIEADVNSVNCRSSSKRVTPLSLLCNKYYHLVKDLRTSCADGEDDDEDDATERDLEANPELRRVWIIGCMLVRAAYHGVATPPPPPTSSEGKSRLVPDWNVLRACAGMEECCWLFVTLCLKLRTDWVFDADEYGNLPLHTAAASPHHPNPEKITAIDVLTTVYPDGCRVRNAEGKLPLHLALESGKRWEGGLSAIHIGWRGAAVVAEPSKPPIVEERGYGRGGRLGAVTPGERGLLPFMRAAVARPRPSSPSPTGGGRGSGKRGPAAAASASSEDGGGDINAIYHLLRDCPELERFAADAAVRAAASSSKKCGGGGGGGGGPKQVSTLRTIGRHTSGATKGKGGCPAAPLGVVVGDADDADAHAEAHVVVAEQVRDPKTRRRHVHVFVEGGDGTRRLRNPRRGRIVTTAASAVAVEAEKKKRAPGGVQTKRRDPSPRTDASTAVVAPRRRGRPKRPREVGLGLVVPGGGGFGDGDGDDYDYLRTRRRRVTRGTATRVTRSMTSRR